MISVFGKGQLFHFRRINYDTMDEKIILYFFLPLSIIVGSVMAAAWVTLRYLGQDGYISTARKLKDTVQKLIRGVSQIKVGTYRYCEKSEHLILSCIIHH